MRYRYRLHERVVSSDLELPFLVQTASGEEPRLELRLGRRDAAVPDGAPWYRGDGIRIERDERDDALVRFADGTVFRVTHDGRSVTLLTAPAHYTDGDLAAYALGPLLALALHLQGALLLHASAAVIADRAVLFAGSSGSGKSTTAALLHREGCEVLCDDLAEISGTAAIRSVPALRLWPEPASVLYRADAIFPDRAPSWDKQLVATETAARERYDIAAILFLEGERSEQPRLERLAARQAWQRLTANLYAARLPGAETRLFTAVTALAERIPAYAFTAPAMTHAPGLREFLAERLA